MDSSEHKPAGWYPDASTPSLERWWNGISWGDQTRPANSSKPMPTVPMTAPLPVDPYAQSTSGRPPAAGPALSSYAQFRRYNQAGYAGVTLGFVSLFFNVYCIPSALAIILSSVGLANAHKLKLRTGRAIGWYWCIPGVVVGVAETAFYAANAIR